MACILELEKQARKANIPIMTKEGIDFLVEYIKKNKVKQILEIGSAVGYSAICMAIPDKDIKVTTIERDVDRYREAVKNIQDFALQEQIEIILGDALDIILEKKYDLIFIDAAKSQYIKFFEKFKENLAINGVIVSDNLAFHGLVNGSDDGLSKNVKGIVRKLRNYIAFLKQNKEFKTNFYSIGDGISISRRQQ